MVEHPLFRGDAQRLGAWSWLVLKACWKPTPFDISGRTVTLERGQLCVSRAQLATAWGWSPSAVERFLTRLEAENMIDREAGQGRTVLTICNYAKYQDNSEAPGQPNGRDPTRTGGRSKTGQATGQPNNDATHGNDDLFEQENEAPGQPTGQRSDSHRTTKEQGNKGTSSKRGDKSPLRGRGRAREDQIPPQIPEWIPVEPWEAFLAMRKKKRATPTDYATRLLIKKLDELRSEGHDAGSVLDQSTRKNWIDLYPLKDRKNERSDFDSRDGFERALDRDLGRS